MIMYAGPKPAKTKKNKLESAPWVPNERQDGY